MMQLRVLAVASEVYPLVKTGGLADVVGALPKALRAQDVETRTLVPGYPAVLAGTQAWQEILHIPDCHGGPARLLAGSCAEVELFVLDAPHLFARPGNPYLGPDGADWPDNAIRFASLGRIGAEIGQGAIPAFMPDIVHAHDWQAGLTHAFLHYSDHPRPGTVMTVHNLAYQGQFPHALLHELGLPPQSFGIDGVEYYGAIGFLKAGLQFADRITTVSPTYAAEIQDGEAGMGLGGLLSARSNVLSGIVNGIDTDVWNPATDNRIVSRFSPAELEVRAPNKAALQQRFGLPITPDALLLGIISRLSWQKGLDLLLENLPLILREGMQVVLLGNGDPELEERYQAAANTHPNQIGVVVGYDEDLAHRIQAGADAIVVPSRFEPCGLTQLCALRYGAIPIVSRVGGLADTVVDADGASLAQDGATGITFAPVNSATLAQALHRAKAFYRDRRSWLRMQKNAMAVDVSWLGPARRYAELYRGISGIISRAQ
jgi:starch synthase